LTSGIAPPPPPVETTLHPQAQVSTKLDPAQGPPGPPGPSGPPGPAGDAPTSYSLVGASSWSVTHGLGYFPEAYLVSSTGEAVDVAVEYPDVNSVAISFPQPFTGTVLLR
jgi:hypothetical protein